MVKPKFTPSPRTTSAPKTPDEFIEQAGKIPDEMEVKTFPWESLDDKKRREPFNIRFTECEKAMLKYIDENTPDSMHEFCINILKPAILAKIKELTGKDPVNSTSAPGRVI